MQCSCASCILFIFCIEGLKGEFYSVCWGAGGICEPLAHLDLCFYYNSKWHVMNLISSHQYPQIMTALFHIPKADEQ